MYTYKGIILPLPWYINACMYIHLTQHFDKLVLLYCTFEMYINSSSYLHKNSELISYYVYVPIHLQCPYL